ncbi:MAG TPA: hypothetical protein VFL15_04530 [Gammaproteobacteria bacterium]|nr:hypothetical protein [Gammaproteobacteria bacterium]
MSRVWISPTANWAPDRRASLPLAALATLLALCGFVLLLMQPAPPRVRPDSVSILLLAAAASDQAGQRHKPAPVAAAVHRVSHPLRRLQHDPAPLQRAPGRPDPGLPPLPSAAPAFLQPRPARESGELARTLNAPRKLAPDLQDRDGYRSAAGEAVIKSAGECGRVQTIQMSPSPTNKATIGFLTDCPGEYQPTLGEQLLKWAETKPRPAPPSPR